MNNIEVCYHEASGNIKGGMSIRFNSGKKIPQYVDLQNQIIKLFIPFTGSEKKCWDCGRNRELIIELDLNGNFIQPRESCDNS